MEYLIFVQTNALPPPSSRAATELEEQDVEAEELYNEAQNWTASGSGLYGGKMGQKTTFIIQPNDEFGNPVDLIHGSFDASGLSVVMENDDLHFDLSIEMLDSHFSVTYEPPRKGPFELSVMLQGYDIYGGPFHPVIEGAPVCASHCTAEGLGVVCAVSGKTNEFKIHLLNDYDEPIDGLDDYMKDVVVYMDHPLVLDQIVMDGESTCIVTYFVNEVNDTDLTCAIAVHINDKRSMILTHRPIKGSPFTPGLSSSSDPSDLAQAFSAHEFMVSQGSDAGKEESKDNDVMTRFQSFYGMLRSSGMFQGIGVEDDKPRRLSIDSGPKQSQESMQYQDSSSFQTTQHQIPNTRAYHQQEQEPPRTFQQEQRMPSRMHQQEQQIPSRMYQQEQRMPSKSNDMQDNVAPSYLSGATSFRPLPPSGINPSGNNPPWKPHDHESEMVRKSLESRAKEIEVEKEELLRRRKELDASRDLVDGQVKRMAQIGMQVQADTERIVQNARSIAQATSPIYSAKENWSQKPNQGSMQLESESSAMEKPVATLLEKHVVVLSRVFDYYLQRGNGATLDIGDIVQLAQDYDITPTFISRKEIRDVCLRNEKQEISYPVFVTCLANIAIESLSKPMFAHLYSSSVSKVNVLLTMWGLADPTKLSEIQDME